MATASGYVVFAYPHEYSSKYCLHTHMRTTPKLEKCLHTVCKGTDMRTCMCLCVCVCVCACVHACVCVIHSHTYYDYLSPGGVYRRNQAGNSNFLEGTVNASLQGYTMTTGHILSQDREGTA